ncbi:septation protein SepH [Microbacterium amylolyticum]|uniref:DUF3071 domain-containing protein n=1 Tax=Microbacterium amylolyticum TaxID=936337 RepID=A0ABS4ZEN5_9MICO|nr:septation protein SepH [Microbacterium amylolyticum]MBP2435483.1 hypothetical protein [Microbacterium amylolyticum]
MENLTIVGTEGLKLVLATDKGQRFTLDIDDMLRSEMRKARTEAAPGPRETGPGPREIQAQIRAGLSAEHVAEILQCSIDRVRLFEGPVLAEREHIVGRALAMPVLTDVQIDRDEMPTFGTAIREKLTDLAAVGERWTSWKTDEEWVVKLTFTASGVEHDARWTFDPRRSALAPANDDAAQLSRQGKVPDGLIPRLRALDSDGSKDDSSFDKNAFQIDEQQPEPQEEKPVDTADLLEALRRRRGQREAPSSPSESDSAVAPRPLAIIGSSPEREERSEPSAPEDGTPDATPDDQNTTPVEPSRRRGRPAMPSWDEIVFGARSDD